MDSTTDKELLERVSPTLQARYLPLAKSGVRLFDFMGGRRSGKTWFILQKLIGRDLKGEIVSVATMTENQGEMGAYADTLDILNGIADTQNVNANIPVRIVEDGLDD